MFSKKLLAVVIGFVCWQSYAKVLVITPVYNRPDFIEMQYKTFKKFLKDDYEFKVFNDADNPVMEQEIKNMCARYGVECIRVPQNRHNVNPLCYRAVASFRHGESLQFAFEEYAFKHDDIVLLLDSDVFLIHDLNVHEFMGDADVYGFADHQMFFPQLCIMDMPKLNNREAINFRADFLPDGHFMDVSCFNEFYTKDHPEMKKKIGSLFWGIHNNNDRYCLHLDKGGDIAAQLRPMGYTPIEIKLVKAIVDTSNEASRLNPESAVKICMDCNIGFYETNLFVDYKHGSGWHGPNPGIKIKKDQIFKEFMKELLAE